MKRIMELLTLCAIYTAAMFVWQAFGWGPGSVAIVAASYVAAWIVEV